MGGGDGTDVDVVVVGAGFAGLYAAHRFRLAGLSMRIIEAGDDIGGTWYWNRYPGARVDIPSVDYMFSFDSDWSRDWQWSEKYATQPEILRYLNHVADKHDLRRDIQFGAKVTHAHWDDNSSAYCVRTDRGDEIVCRYLVMATGCLSMPKQLDIDGVENFTREVYFTSRWPHQASTSPANASPSSAPGRRASSRSRSSQRRQRSWWFSNARRAFRSPPTTVRFRRTSSPN